MRQALLCAVAVLACGAAASQHTGFPWHLSGNDFVTQVSGQQGTTKWEQNAEAVYKQRYAEGYLAGVVDATQGRLWCAPPRMKPAEVDDRVWSEMRKRAGSMPGNAADQLIQLYAARFPCNR